MESMSDWETMGYAKHCFEELVKCMEKMQVDWWVRQGWSLRKLPPDIFEPGADSRQTVMWNDGEVVHAPTDREELGRRGQELRGGDRDAGGERGPASLSQRLVREALSRRTPRSPRRRRKARR